MSEQVGSLDQKNENWVYEIDTSDFLNLDLEKLWSDMDQDNIDSWWNLRLYALRLKKIVGTPEDELKNITDEKGKPSVEGSFRAMSAKLRELLIGENKGKDDTLKDRAEIKENLEIKRLNSENDFDWIYSLTASELFELDPESLDSFYELQVYSLYLRNVVGEPDDELREVEESGVKLPEGSLRALGSKLKEEMDKKEDEVCKKSNSFWGKFLQDIKPALEDWKQIRAKPPRIEPETVIQDTTPIVNQEKHDEYWKLIEPFINKGEIKITKLWNEKSYYLMQETDKNLVLDAIKKGDLSKISIEGGGIIMGDDYQYIGETKFIVIPISKAKNSNDKQILFGKIKLKQYQSKALEVEEKRLEVILFTPQTEREIKLCK